MRCFTPVSIHPEWLDEKETDMGLNPLQEKGMPIEKQLRNWAQLNVTPYDKNQVHPYTRCRAILMNGIEVEGAVFSHQFARHCPDPDLKRKLALTRRIEQQQQKGINWLVPADESTIEVTIGYEQVAVDLTASFARAEPDPYVKSAFEFALLEDFDHLYRYANLLDLVQGKKAQEITGDLTEITVGRPTRAEHRHPFDDVRRPYDRKKADTITQLHCMTIMAGEQQTMNFYMNVGNRMKEKVGRGLYLEIGQIEEQHVTHYESLIDPNCSWFERLVMHEYNECWLYHCLAQEEVDPRIKKIWETYLEMEIEHLKTAVELMKQNEKRDAAEMLPKEFPKATIFQSNIPYIREVIAREADWNAAEVEFVPGAKMPKPAESRYEKYQGAVNPDGEVPSEQVIAQHIGEKGQEYRYELKGPHPVQRFQMGQRTANA